MQREEAALRLMHEHGDCSELKLEQKVPPVFLHNSRAYITINYIMQLG